MAKNVRALEDGFYGGARRRKGAVFAIPDTAKLGKWMEEIKPAKEPAKATAQVKEAKGKKESDDLA